jgi:hypothetical protein
MARARGARKSGAAAPESLIAIILINCGRLKFYSNEARAWFELAALFTFIRLNSTAST